DAALLVSQAWSWGAVHLNLQAQLTPEHHADLFLETILEGPRDWKVRPVLEIFNDRTIGGPETRSVLVGAIWQVRETLSFDAALRGARINDPTLGSHTLGELRAGFTFAFGVVR